MHRQDWESGQICAQCGTSMKASTERGYGFGVGNALCWTCALERGGRYDAELDTWTEAPDVADLPDEAYGATPGEAQRPPT